MDSWFSQTTFLSWLFIYFVYVRKKKSWRVFEGEWSTINFKTIAFCADGLNLHQMLAISRNVSWTGGVSSMNVRISTHTVFCVWLGYWTKVSNNENLWLLRCHLPDGKWCLLRNRERKGRPVNHTLLPLQPVEPPKGQNLIKCELVFRVEYNFTYFFFFCFGDPFIRFSHTVSLGFFILFCFVVSLKVAILYVFISPSLSPPLSKGGKSLNRCCVKTAKLILLLMSCAQSYFWRKHWWNELLVVYCTFKSRKAVGKGI